jgi:hypothetical protein
MKGQAIQGNRLFFGAAIALSTTALATGIAVSYVPAASAQAAYGSYVGVGGSVGLTDTETTDTDAAGVIALRYRLLEIPVSLRAQALISDTTAIVPTISYDIPLDWYTDAYVGAGVAFQDADPGEASPVGERTSFVIQPGIDHRLTRSQVVVFGNAIIAFDAYRNSSNTAVSLQGGLGLRF